MSFKHDDDGICVRCNHRRKRFWTGLTLACVVSGAVFLRGSVSRASATAGHCEVPYDANATYPPLPNASGPDVNGDAGLIIYLHLDHAVVEIDECFYTVTRELRIDFGRYDFMTLLFELPDHPEGAEVFVTSGSSTVGTVETVETVETALPYFLYEFRPEQTLEFEIAAAGQALPTIPVVTTKPSSENPDP